MGYYESENVFNLYDTQANAIIKVREVISFEDVLGHEIFRSVPGGPLPLNQNILGAPHDLDPESFYADVR